MDTETWVVIVNNECCVEYFSPSEGGGGSGLSAADRAKQHKPGHQKEMCLVWKAGHVGLRSDAQQNTPNTHCTKHIPQMEAVFFLTFKSY